MHEAMKTQRALHTSPASSISMIGFMGSGKTSVGRHLARMTGMEFIDTDQLIEEKVGKSIPEFFKAYGEDAFRAIERSVFETLDLTSEKIISCGGGAIKDSAIRTLLREHSTIVWLWSSLSTTLARIRKGARPLLGVGNIEEKAKKIFTERVALYTGCADLMIVNETVSARNIAKRIYDEIYSAGKH
jgi:shikimate kinase